MAIGAESGGAEVGRNTGDEDSPLQKALENGNAIKVALYDLETFIGNPTREALLGGQSVEEALEGVDERDRDFMRKVLLLSFGDPQLLRVIVDARTRLGNGVKISQPQASLLLEELGCWGFDLVDLDVSGYRFGELHMSEAEIGGELRMNGVEVVSDSFQDRMKVGGDNYQDRMKVGGNNCQDDMEVSGDNCQDDMEVSGSNWQDDMKVGGDNYQNGMEVGGDNCQDNMKESRRR